MARRVHYIDWLRVLAVLLLFPFHTSRVFNNADPFYVKSAYLSQTLNYLLGFIDRWHMPLLFVLAGASTYFAMHKRTGGQYLGERVKRLLVPLLFGFLVLIPPQTYLGGRFNSGYTPTFWHYLSSTDFLVWNLGPGGDYYGGFGIGHLWFILFLFIVSLLALPLVLWGRTERGTRAMTRFSHLMSHPAGWLLVAFLILLGEGLPDIAGKNPFYFLVFFVLGYAAMFDEVRFAERAERYRWLALGLGTALIAFWMLTGELRATLPDPSLPLLGVVMAGMLASWLMIVAAFGFGRRHLDRTSARLAYLAEASYPVYILHQTVIVLAAWWVIRLPGPWPVQWVALFALGVAGTFGLYELVRRVAVLRFLFGMRPAAKP